MKSTTNVFLSGLTTDVHPLVTANTQLTDALNATFITYNGNEMMLQNDMGNTLIQDSTTGAIMGLRDGFIPIGMKEHGGIMYIASYNPKTQLSEIGSIPSPVFDYTYNPGGQALLDLNKKLVRNGLSDIPAFRLSSERFSVGDVFYLDLDITEGNSSIKRKYKALDNTTEQEAQFPSITNGKDGYGLISLHLLANCDQINKEVDLNVHLDNLDSVEHRWYHRWDADKSSKIESGRGGFIPYAPDDVLTDAESIFAAKNVIHYPNFQTGTLSLKPMAESPEDIAITLNSDSLRPEPYFLLVHIVTVDIKLKGGNGTLWVDGVEIANNHYHKLFVNKADITIKITDGLVNMPRPTDYDTHTWTELEEKKEFRLQATTDAYYVLTEENGGVIVSKSIAGHIGVYRTTDTEDPKYYTFMDGILGAAAFPPDPYSEEGYVVTPNKWQLSDNIYTPIVVDDETKDFPQLKAVREEYNGESHYRNAIPNIFCLTAADVDTEYPLDSKYIRTYTDVKETEYIRLYSDDLIDSDTLVETIGNDGYLSIYSTTWNPLTYQLMMELQPVWLAGKNIRMMSPDMPFNPDESFCFSYLPYIKNSDWKEALKEGETEEDLFSFYYSTTGSLEYFFSNFKLEPGKSVSSRFKQHWVEKGTNPYVVGTLCKECSSSTEVRARILNYYHYDRKSTVSIPVLETQEQSGIIPNINSDIYMDPVFYGRIGGNTYSSAPLSDLDPTLTKPFELKVNIDIKIHCAPNINNDNFPKLLLQQTKEENALISYKPTNTIEYYIGKANAIFNGDGTFSLAENQWDAGKKLEPDALVELGLIQPKSQLNPMLYYEFSIDITKQDNCIDVKYSKTDGDSSKYMPMLLPLLFTFTAQADSAQYTNMLISFLGMKCQDTAHEDVYKNLTNKIYEEGTNNLELVNNLINHPTAYSVYPIVLEKDDKTAFITLSYRFTERNRDNTPGDSYEVLTINVPTKRINAMINLKVNDSEKTHGWLSYKPDDRNKVLNGFVSFYDGFSSNNPDYFQKVVQLTPDKNKDVFTGDAFAKALEDNNFQCYVENETIYCGGIPIPDDGYLFLPSTYGKNYEAKVNNITRADSADTKYVTPINSACVWGVIEDFDGGLLHFGINKTYGELCATVTINKALELDSYNNLGDGINNWGYYLLGHHVNTIAEQHRINLNSGEIDLSFVMLGLQAACLRISKKCLGFIGVCKNWERPQWTLVSFGACSTENDKSIPLLILPITVCDLPYGSQTPNEGRDLEIFIRPIFM